MTLYDFGDTIDEKTEFVVFGIPWDYLSSLEVANCALAPQSIRSVTSNLALTTELGIEIPSLKVVDIGNVEIEPDNVEQNLMRIKEYVMEIYEQKDDVILVMIGGDHFCTYPVVKSIGNNLSDSEKFGVLIFDAHLDLYEKWDKRVYSHATISHRIFDLDYINKYNLLIVGSRDIDIPELNLAKEHDIPMAVIPGPCALIAALSLSGMPTDSFIFAGFLPVKSSARKRKLEGFKDEKKTIIFYESPHRLIKTLKDIEEVLGDARVVCARELTKKFEEVREGTAGKLLEHFVKIKPRGEFVLLI